MKDRFERFTFAIFEIAKYWHKIAAEVMEAYGLKGPYAIYFIQLYKFKDGLTAARLAETSSRDKADVSRALGALTEKGLVEKLEVNNNGYRAVLTLTEKGLFIAESIYKKAGEAVEFVGKDLSDKDREIFYSSLEKITLNLELLAKGEK